MFPALWGTCSLARGSGIQDSMSIMSAGFLKMDHLGKGRKKWRLMYFSTNEKHLLKFWVPRKKLWERCRWFRDMAMKPTPLNTLNVSEGDSNGLSSTGWKLERGRVTNAEVAC